MGYQTEQGCHLPAETREQDAEGQTLQENDGKLLRVLPRILYYRKHAG